MRQQKNRLLLGAAIAAVVIAGAPVVAKAQTMGADRPVTVSIPAQGLADALRQFAEASGLQLVYDAKIADGKSSPGLSGTMTGRAALEALLAGSGLGFQFSGDRTVVITAAANGIRAIGVVRVEGAGGNMPYDEMVSPLNGTNGSRDVEATEGTGSYTTGATSIVSKIPQTLRETPQSVSVITSQRIADQNLVSVKDILDAMPGTSYVPGPNSEEFNIYSRGFLVNTYSFDGGAPVVYNNGNRPAFNTSEFDSVQLVRGADGLFGGYGDPGGMVNLVRKKPLDHEQLTYTQDIGSFDYFREEVDATSPLTKDHSLRARAVFSRQDNDYFYDFANSHKTSIYGVLEYDLTPTTLLTFGASYNRERNIPNSGGLPRYTDGSAIDFPRSTCLCLPFVYDHSDRTELFATISQKLATDISTKANVTYNFERVDALYYGLSGAVDRGGAANGTFGGYLSRNPVRDFAADYTLTGKFHLFNRENAFVIGANYRYVNNDGGATYFLPNIDVPDVFHFNPNQYQAPAIPTSPDSLNIRSRERDFGGYANLRLEIFKNLHVMTGMRYSTYSQDGIAHYSYSPDDQVSPPLKDHSHSSPNIGVTYDFFKNFTLFGSHEKVYQPQLYTRQVDAQPVPPVTGVNDEAGLKWQSTNKKINASISYYKIVQKGFLTQDYNNPGSDIPLINNTRSKGVDFEVAGEILPGWQLSASYSYNENTFTTAAYPSGTSTDPGTSFTPKNKGKLFTTYHGQPGSPISRLIFGGGVNYQSSAYNTGYVCNSLPTSPTDYCHGFSPYAFTTKGYTTLSLMIGYKISKNIEASVTAKNITNVKAYLASPYQNVAGYNFYIDPLNILAAVRVKF